MLTALRLRDFVIVEAVELEFGPGFTVLSGETGAGKSILIDALGLALGARADSGVVREGAPRANIVAEFTTDARLDAWLDTAQRDDDAVKTALQGWVPEYRRQHGVTGG